MVFQILMGKRDVEIKPQLDRDLTNIEVAKQPDKALAVINLPSEFFSRIQSMSTA